MTARATASSLESQWIGDARAAAALVFLHEGLGSLAQWRDIPGGVARATGLPAFVYSRRGLRPLGAASRVPRPLDVHARRGARRPAARCSTTLGIDRADPDRPQRRRLDRDHRRRRRPRQRRAALVADRAARVRRGRLGRLIAAARDAYEHGDLRARLAKYHADVDGAFWGWNRRVARSRLPRLEPRGVPAARSPRRCWWSRATADQYGTLAQVDAIERQLAGPVETMLVEGAGHAPFRDAPAAVAARIAQFLELST